MKPVIICVDDEIFILDSLKMELKEKFGSDYSIEVAENATDALDLIDDLVARSIEIPILISDYIMPGIKGDELLILAHEKIPGTFKIMLTGQAEIQGIENAINKAGLYRFLSKPWESKDFLLTVGEALKSFHQASQIKIQNLELEKSEKKYKGLVENSTDIIFSLDKEERILAINQSVSRILRYNGKKIIGKPFIEIIYKPDSINGKVFREMMNELILTKEKVAFHCDFVTILGEPRMMLLKLQYVNVENEFYIFGTASILEEDLLIRLCKKEIQVYRIENFITQIDLVSKRISDAILKYSNEEFAYHLKTCLREILINAMEHGNLEISFEEKSLALEKDEYFDLLFNRQHSQSNRDKRIEIDYALKPEKVEIRITDEGNGFDHKKRILVGETDESLNKLGHGRGLQMTKLFFDIFEYNEKGNSVFLVKKFI